MIFEIIRFGLPMILTVVIFYYFFKKINLRKEQIGEEAMADELTEKLFNYLEIPDEVEENEREPVIMAYVKQNGYITLKKASGILWCGKVKTEEVLTKLTEDGKLTKEKKFLSEYYLIVN